jgi:hypothetical protein
MCIFEFLILKKVVVLVVGGVDKWKTVPGGSKRQC